MILEGKVALLTGAGSGIGRATAALMAHEGARVALLDRSADALADVEQQICDDGGQAIRVQADVSVPEQVAAAVATVVDTWGRLDILFANAGVNGTWAPLDELTCEEWNQTLAINLTGTFLALKYAVPHLKKRGGAVVVTSSVNGTRIFSNAGASAYSSSKAGQVALTKMAALELAEHGIRVNVICPGGVRTDIGQNTEHRNTEHIGPPAEYPEGRIPLTEGRSAQPIQVARVVLFLASDQANHVTGAEVFIDGAESLLQG